MRVIEERDGKRLVSVKEGGRWIRKWISATDPKPGAKKKTAKKKASKKPTK